MTFTLQPEKTTSAQVQRLYADGRPTLILLTDAEISALERNGPTIDHAGLRSLFSRSPYRLEMLREILR